MTALEDCLPSSTALMAAAARAAHAVVDNPPQLICDRDAQALCALFEPSPLDFQLAYPHEPVLAAARVSAVIRAAFARQALAASGLDQCVVLGAGLDTSMQHDTAARVWLVDRPDVLAWRAELFSRAGLVDSGTAVAEDLGGAELLARLADAGLDRRRPTMVIGLGLSMYLTPPQNRHLLAELADLAESSQLVLDAILPDIDADDAGRRYTSAVAAMVGASGEPWQTRVGFESAARSLSESGWRVLSQVAEAEVAPTRFWEANPHLQTMRLVQLIHACRSETGTVDLDESVG